MRDILHKWPLNSIHQNKIQFLLKRQVYKTLPLSSIIPPRRVLLSIKLICLWFNDLCCKSNLIFTLTNFIANLLRNCWGSVVCKCEERNEEKNKNLMRCFVIFFIIVIDCDNSFVFTTWFILNYSGFDFTQLKRERIDQFVCLSGFVCSLGLANIVVIMCNYVILIDLLVFCRNDI